MRVLVLGAAGFIGSHLVDSLLAVDARVIGVDNFITGTRRNIAHLQDHALFSFLQADITDPWDAIKSIGKTYARPTHVIHLASPASPSFYLKHQLATLRANSIGTDNAIKYACESGAAFVFASTSEVYGDPTESPQSEFYNGQLSPVGARSSYYEGKRYGEALAKAFSNTSDADVRILRIFNTYGPRMRPDDGRVVPTFVTQALHNEPLTIYGDGYSTRSLCYVSDIVSGIVRAMNAPSAKGAVLNLGNPDERTILDIGRLVCEVVGVPFQQRWLPRLPEDPRRRCPDISVARSVLGWEPSVTLEEGLRATVRSFRGSEDGAAKFGTSRSGGRHESVTARG